MKKNSKAIIAQNSTLGKVKTADAFLLKNVGSDARLLKQLKKEQTDNKKLRLKIHQIQVQNNKQINEIKKYVSLYNNAPVGYISIDKKGIIKEGNKHTSRLLGESKQAFKHVNFRHYLDRDSAKVFDEYLKKAFLGKGYFSFDLILKKGDKSTFVFITITKVRYEEMCFGLIIEIDKINNKQKQLLQLNEERLKFAFEGNKEGVWDWNIVNNEVYFSPEWKEMIGYKDHEIENHFNEWEKRVHPDDLANANNEIRKALKIKNYNYTLEHRMLCKNGKYKWIVAKGKVLVWDKKGKPERMVGTHTDINQLKLNEQELKQNEKLISTILQTLPVGVYAKDIKNKFSFYIWNQSAEFIYGKKADEVIGKTDYDFFTKKAAANFRKKDLELSYNTTQIDIPIEEVQTQNGALVQTKKTIVKDDKGNPIYLIGVSEDVTERKAAEKFLKESEEKFRSLVENSPIIIITTDKEQNVTFINYTEAGYSKNYIIGKSIYDFISPEHIESVKHYHQSVFRTQTIQSYEIESISSNGERAWYQSHVGPIMLEGKVNGLTIFTRDITSRKTSEKKIEQSLKEKEVLLNEVHHRVKNNLQIISSILNLQKTKITDQKTLDILNDSQDRIKSMSIIHELLYQTKDFSRINFSIYISKIASNLVNSYSKNNNVELILKVDPAFLNLDISIPCGLIVNELVTNALKYAFNDMKRGKLKISLNQSKSQIKLTISDNGKGLPKNINYKKTQSLGMQLVMALLEQIDGKISLNNLHGASYTITLNRNSTNSKSHIESE